MLDMAGVQEAVREFIADDVVGSREVDPWNDETSLFGSVLDSIGLLRLEFFIEDAFLVTVDAADFTVENFGSVQAIAKFVMARRTVAG